MTERAILDQIMYRDPDGGPKEPTEADYRRFRDWAVQAYGLDAWLDYKRGGWAEPGHVREPLDISGEYIPAFDDEYLALCIAAFPVIAGQLTLL